MVYNLIQWPDGGCYMDQENLLVDVFTIINSELAEIRGREIESIKRRNKRGR